MSYQEKDFQTSQQAPLSPLSGSGGAGLSTRPPAHPLSWMSSSAAMVGNLAQQNVSLSSPGLGSPNTAAKSDGAAHKAAPFAGMYDEGKPATAAKPAAPRSTPTPTPSPTADKGGSGYQSAYPSVFLSGITDEANNAREAGEHVTGHASGVALYEGQSASGDAKHDPNARTPDLNSSDPAVRDAANKKNSQDMGLDMLAVTQFGRAGDAVQIDKNGHLQVDEKTMQQQIQIGGKDGEKYMSPAAVGSAGAQAAINSNPDLAKLIAQGHDPKSDEKVAKQFISITGHSGGGQSSFYTAIELYEKGFRNLSVVGYDMAITPHQREVLQKLGVQVTNVTGHTGSKDNYMNSVVGEGIRDGMGGGQNYYDASIDRGGGEDLLSQHGVTNNDRVTVMLRYATWLDSVGKHQQFTEQTYKEFLKATGGTGDNVAGTDGKQHDAASPMSGSFVNNAGKKDDIYLQTPKVTGGDLINGISNIPLVGGWLGAKTDSLASGMIPGFKDTQLPRLDVGINPNVQAQGSVNASQGAAQGGVNLAGSSIDIAGAHLTAGNWAQASGGVNASQGAANFNVGGQNGVGADMNIAKGNLDLNVFGHKVDVDQGLRNAWHGVTGLFGH